MQTVLARLFVTVESTRRYPLLLELSRKTQHKHGPRLQCSDGKTHGSDRVGSPFGSLSRTLSRQNRDAHSARHCRPCRRHDRRVHERAPQNREFNVADGRGMVTIGQGGRALT